MDPTPHQIVPVRPADGRAPSHHPAWNPGAGHPRALVVAIVGFLVVALTAGPALAYHDDETKVTEDTAYTLRDGELRLGLWKFEWGVLDDLDIGTYVLPWLLRFASIYTKYEFWHDDTWAFGGRLGLSWMDLKNIDAIEDAGTARVYVIPVEVVASWRFHDDLTWSFGGAYTKVGVSGEFESQNFEGAAAVTNFQFTSTFEWRLGDVTALLLHGRYLAYQDASAATTFTFEPDDYTTVEVIGAAKSDAVDVQHASSIALSAVFSWETFNLRIGAGYGNWNVPMANFVIPDAIPFPDFAAYWRW